MLVYHLIFKYQGKGLVDWERRLPMSLAPSVAVPRAGFNPLPLYIGLFCLLWSFAFVAGKIGVTDCPPLILFTLASLASIVAGTILFKVLAPKGSLWVGNGVQNLAAGIVLLPFAFTFSSMGDIVPSTRLLAAFAFLVLGGSILAYLLWFHLLKVCGATAASAYHFLMPPLGMLFAFLVLGEHVEFRDLLGIVPVALGIYLVTRPAAAAGQS